jgi:hypothetical protein
MYCLNCSISVLGSFLIFYSFPEEETKISTWGHLQNGCLRSIFWVLNLESSMITEQQLVNRLYIYVHYLLITNWLLIIICTRFDCEYPYDLLDDTHLKIAEFEDEMSNIQDSASLFEVNVPDFKQIKQCRKELLMLKVKQLTLVVM